MSKPHTAIHIERASPVLGAEVRGIDLSAPVSASLGAELGQALLRHHLLIFREQALAPEDLVRIARLFGDLTPYPFLRGLSEAPLVAPVIKEPWDTGVFGGGWHTDTPYLPEPAKATMLYALEVPESGGDTLFSNLQLAYRDLPEATKDRIGGLRGVFTSTRVHDESGDFSQSAGRAQDRAHEPALDGVQAVHPLVRRHADTGALSLYLSPLHLCEIVGMASDQAVSIISELNRHATEERFCFRLKWRSRTLAIWDNRCLLHCPVDDYDGQRRVMHRVSLKGEAPQAPRTG